MSGGHIRREPDDVGPVAVRGLPLPDIGPHVVGFTVGSHRGEAYGELSVEDGSTAETTTDTTPRKLGGWAVEGLSFHTVVSATTDDVEITHEGAYSVQFTVSFTGSNSKHYHRHSKT